MDLSSPEAWRWIWLAAAVMFALAEMVTAGTLFFLPFAVGALLASLAGFAGADVAIEWLAFVGASGLAFAVLWPIGRRMDRRSQSHAIGANRWVGRQAVVLADIPAELGGTGLIRLDREEWRAESGVRVPIPAGSTVLVTRVDGTRLVVLPIEDPPMLPVDRPAAGPEQGGVT